MTILSKTSEECKACKYFDDCDSKRMVMCAMAEMPPQILAPAAESATSPLMQDMAFKHDYRDIWIDSNTTVTIDLEDVKKQIKRDFYKTLNCPWLNYGA